MEIFRVQEITDEVFEAFQRLTPQLSAGSPAPARAHLDEMLAQPCCVLLAARTGDGRIAGVLTLILFSTPMGKHAWIEDVVVDEAARGQGLGMALTRAALEQARAAGAKNVNLTSRPARAAANRLYLRAGFQHWQTNLYRYVFEDVKREM